MKARTLTLSDVCGLLQRGVSAADAFAAYYAGRTDFDLAASHKECLRTIAIWEEYSRPTIVAHSRERLGVILAEVERRQLAATRGEVSA